MDDTQIHEASQIFDNLKWPYVRADPRHTANW